MPNSAAPPQPPEIQAADDAAASSSPPGPVEELAAKAAATASTLYSESRAFLSSNAEVARAADELSQAVRRNPLAAVGMAFTAGLVLALLVKG